MSLSSTEENIPSSPLAGAYGCGTRDVDKRQVTGVQTKVGQWLGHQGPGCSHDSYVQHTALQLQLPPLMATKRLPQLLKSHLHTAAPEG